MNFFNPPLPSKSTTHITWGQIYGCSKSLALAVAIERYSGLTLIITPDIQSAQILESELTYFCDPSKNIFVFPDYETLPYDVFSPHEDIISDRLLTLRSLLNGKCDVLIVSVTTFMARLAPKSFIQTQTLNLAAGDQLDSNDLKQTLVRAGYQYVSQVMSHGEFAVRGSIIDLYPMGCSQPYRIDLFDDEIETIRAFNPENQISSDHADEIQVLPAKEFPTDENAVRRFRQNYRIEFEGDPNKSIIYRDVSNYSLPRGAEYYLPLFCKQTNTLFNYLPEQYQLVLIEDILEIAKDFDNEVLERYEQRKDDQEFPPLRPEQLWVSPTWFEKQLKQFRTIRLQQHKLERTLHGQYNLGTRTLPALTINSRITDPAGELKRFIKSSACKILFLAESHGRREYLLDVLKGFDLHPRTVTGWQEFMSLESTLAISVGPLEQGLILPESKIAVITESNLFGIRVKQKRKRRRQIRDAEALIKDLAELSEGSPMVHEDHGVGRYRGLKTLNLSGTETEFLTLEYANSDILYVPVSSMHLVSRYTGASEENAPLHRLGGEAWKNIKRRAAACTHDVAVELLDIYSRREARKGYQYAVDHQELNLFGSTFIYEETPDQQKAIDDVIADMESQKPMDRVVCGDVGFGKTEVAMRAAFVAASVGKQVAILVPTTLLALQHFQNFSDRFSDWPIRIEHISRFVFAKNQEIIKNRLKDGSIDIIIGTHKLLSQDIKFRNLGLIIVDEEQRFGVRQKETLKIMRTEVDVLTLTATPIPRTLNMSLSGLRDLSIIATPPNHRHAIKTFIGTWNSSLIQEACIRELKRGGQIFFLHNEVRSIEKTAREIQQLLPDIKVRIAHGKMPERDLEQVMLEFYHQRFSILVCTTIIENGIDIPSANTIIINRADKLGLSQLHQIRGRVGRSRHRAYAYLITPPRAAITEDAVKRLDAIEALEDLGAGFTVATHDLEIRGAGELLGAEQSGQIHEIGFSLYNQLLARTVAALKAGEIPSPDLPPDHGTEVDLGVPALLPENYVPDVHARLILYKRIANAKNMDDLDDLEAELVDRFGLLPEYTKNLFQVTQLKLIAKNFDVTRIQAGNTIVHLSFAKSPNIDITKLLALVQSEPATYKLGSAEKLTVYAEMNNVQERLDTVVGLLGNLRLKQAA